MCCMVRVRSKELSFAKRVSICMLTCRKQRAAGGRMLCERPQVLMHWGLFDLMDMHVIGEGGQLFEGGWLI